MLPFGSLFTQLPLFIIGALYVLYLGLSAVNKERDGLSEETRQVIQTGDSDNNIDYFTLSAMPFHSYAEKPESYFIVPTDFFITNFIFPDKEFQISSFYSFHIFGRPPPES